MPAMDFMTHFDPHIDSLSRKVQSIRNRVDNKRDNAVDDAMNIVEQNLGRKEASEADMQLAALAGELTGQGSTGHSLDPKLVADLISDPFEDD